MADTLVEKKICEACGADVRPGSLFCYNCGGAVSLDLPESKKEKVSAAWMQGDLVENSDLRTKPLDSKAVKTIAVKPIEKPSDTLLVEKNVEIPAEKPNIQEEAKLKSAANMRRKAKTFQKKSVEIVWEAPETGPNKWFPIVAIILILVVVGIFYLAMYLK